MSLTIRKCPQDGSEYDETFIGNCPSCGGPLRFFCKTHGDWLEDTNCPKCAAAPVAAASTRPPSAAPAVLGILAVLAICVGVLVVCGWFAYRAVYSKPAKPQPAGLAAARPLPPPPPAPPAVPPPASKPEPAPRSSEPTPVAIPIRELLADSDPYVGRLVKITGTVQFRDAGKETFDLRDGERILTVQYRGLPAAMRTIIAGSGASQTITVTGTLERDESDNSYFIVARGVQTP